MFLLGLQSSFFGPSKYGLIPALIRPRDLPKANGITSMATNVAVILGMLAGGLFMSTGLAIRCVSMAWPRQSRRCLTSRIPLLHRTI